VFIRAAETVIRHSRTLVEQLGAFAADARFEDISEQAREKLELRVLDSLGCAVGALGACAPALVRAQVEECGGAPPLA
jgi:2-methylcitrate dehydratase